MYAFHRATHPRSRFAVFAVASLLLVACGQSDKTAVDASASPPSPAVGSAQAVVDIEIAPVDACSLLSAADVEAAAGRAPSKPVESHTDMGMSWCHFGEPGSQMVGPRPQSTVATVSVLTGSNSYFKGPVAQVRETFEHWTQGGDASTPVEGLGERAHWQADYDTLRVLQGPYLIEIEVSERGLDGNPIAGEPRKIAEQLAKLALAKLPASE